MINRKLFAQIARFGVVGVLAAIVHFCTVVAVVQATAMQPLIANVFGFLLAFQVSYWGHRYFTFAAHHVLHCEALPRLLLVQSVAFLANEGLFYIFLSASLPYPIALLLTLLIVPAFSFLSARFWVFR